MRLIDADALMEEFAKFVRRSNNSDFAPIQTWNDAVSITESAPTVDAVEVVRCKDCKWFGDFGCAIRIVDDSDKPTENDYCSFAEEKRMSDIERIIAILLLIIGLFAWNKWVK